MRTVRTQSIKAISTTSSFYRASLRLGLQLSVVTLLTLCACGGGTTGTSSSDSLRFSGYAEGADGARAARLSMSVSSASTNDNLVDSGTDDNGDFSMRLPSDEGEFVVNIDGIGATSIARQQSGAGTMASKLSVSDSGALRAQNLFETQVLTSILCENLTANGDTLTVSGTVGSAPCEASFVVASTDMPVTSFRGEIEAICDGSRDVVSSASASSRGIITLNLNAAFSRGCSEVTIRISSSEAPDLVSVFSVK